MNQASGRIVQILGGVVDVVFPAGDLPELFEALEVIRPEGKPLVLEVERQLPDNWVRCIAMDSTDGLMRGLPVRRTYAPITVPVGPATLGRVFNVLGQPVDGKGPVVSDVYYPIRRPALNLPSSPPV